MLAPARSPGNDGFREPNPQATQAICTGSTRASIGFTTAPVRAHNPPIKRAAIDAAIWRYFERVALDVETTRRTVVEHAARKLAEFDALRQEAELELARAESALTRIESDYIAGKISAEKWTHLEDRLTGEMDASRAQAEQQERHHQAIANEIAQFDAEAVIAEELSAMRTAVAAQVQEGAKSDVDSFRATLGVCSSDSSFALLPSRLGVVLCGTTATCGARTHSRTMLRRYWPSRAAINCSRGASPVQRSQSECQLR